MALPNPFSWAARMIAAGAKRLIAVLAREQVEIDMGSPPKSRVKPITRAIERLRREFGEIFGQQAGYEEYRKVWRSQVRAAKRAERESERQLDEIERGIPPTPPKPRRGEAPKEMYTLRVEMINPKTGVSYWSTVFVESPSGMSLTDLKGIAKDAVMTNNRDSRGFGNAKVNSRWDVADVKWIG